MTRSKTIRKIYFQLRSEIGGDISSCELLCLADALLRLSENRDLKDDRSFGEPRRSFEELGIDEALSDGGWRVMSRETALMKAIYQDDEPAFRVANNRSTLPTRMAA